MKKDDLKRWSAKNKLLNKDIVPYLGMEVIDSDGFKGVVVKIEPSTEDHHGFIYVWQSDRFNYGDDNCEHYCFSTWKPFLRLLDYTLT